MGKGVMWKMVKITKGTCTRCYWNYLMGEGEMGKACSPYGRNEMILTKF
jgi:hypothetical protein